MATNGIDEAAASRAWWGYYRQAFGGGGILAAALLVCGLVMFVAIGLMMPEPQHAHVPGPWVIALIPGGMLVIPSVVGVVICVRRANRAMRLLRTGTATQGVVGGVITLKSSRLTSQTVMYGYFDTLRQGHQGETIYLPYSLHDKWKKGDAITVVFNPDLPAEHEADVFGVRGAAE